MAEKLEQKIIDWEVKPTKTIPEADISQATPIEREEILTSTTYKIKDINGVGFYIVISNMEVNGFIRPYEMFINSKDVGHYAYITTITRLISAFFRTGHDYKFISKELQEIVDPKEGNYYKKGVFYTSFVAEIGQILERHFQAIDLANRDRNKS